VIELSYWLVGSKGAKLKVDNDKKVGVNIASATYKVATNRIREILKTRELCTAN
jgi:hypothetical protein